MGAAAPTALMARTHMAIMELHIWIGETPKQLMTKERLLPKSKSSARKVQLITIRTSLLPTCPDFESSVLRVRWLTSAIGRLCAAPQRFVPLRANH